MLKKLLAGSEQLKKSAPKTVVCSNVDAASSKDSAKVYDPFFGIRIS